MSTLHIFFLFIFSHGFSILLATDACAIPMTQGDPVKLGDVPVAGADLVYPKKNSTNTGTTKKTPPVANSIEEVSQSPEGNSNSRYQPITIFSAILTLILCKMI